MSDTRISPELLRRFDTAGPRHTSYPTADRFVEAFRGAPLRAGAGTAQWRADGVGQAAFALRAHPVLRVALLLLRLQQDHHEAPRSAGLEQQGLVSVDETGVQVTADGWFFVRAVAMLFDRYLQADRNRARFSRIL
jgi:hypothetical protein